MEAIILKGTRSIALIISSGTRSFIPTSSPFNAISSIPITRLVTSPLLLQRPQMQLMLKLNKELFVRIFLACYHLIKIVPGRIAVNGSILHFDNVIIILSNSFIISVTDCNNCIIKFQEYFLNFSSQLFI